MTESSGAFGWLWGAGIFGVLASCWSYVRAVVWKVCQLFVQRVEIRENFCGEAVIAYLINNYKRSRLYDRVYSSMHEHIRIGDDDIMRYGLVAFERFGSGSLNFLELLFSIFLQWSK